MIGINLNTVTKQPIQKLSLTKYIYLSSKLWLISFELIMKKEIFRNKNVYVTVNEALVLFSTNCVSKDLLGHWDNNKKNPVIPLFKYRLVFHSTGATTFKLR